MKILIALLLMCSIAWAAERQNIQVDSNYAFKDKEYVMCNFYSAPKTPLIAKGVTFKRCNFFGGEVDETNTLIQTNIIDITPKSPEKTQDERIKQLEDFITSKGFSIPK